MTSTLELGGGRTGVRHRFPLRGDGPPLGRLLAVYAILVVVFSIAADGFLSWDNALNIGRAGSFYGIAALGVSIAMISGSVDVSFGSVMSASAVVAAERLDAGNGPAVAIIAGLVVGVVLGVINGSLARLLRLDAMIVTLGTLSIFSGFVFLRTNGVPVSAPGDTFAEIGRGEVVGLPTPLVIFVGCAVVLAAVMRYTTFGQHCYMVGDSPRAAELVGISAVRIRIMALALSGLLAAVGGLVVVANAGVGNPGSGARYLLPALAAIVVGGVSLGGGRGSVAGVVLGVMLLGTIDNGLNLLEVSSNWQDVIRGTIIVAGLVLDRLNRTDA